MTEHDRWTKKEEKVNGYLSFFVVFPTVKTFCIHGDLDNIIRKNEKKCFFFILKKIRNKLVGSGIMNLKRGLKQFKHHSTRKSSFKLPWIKNLLWFVNVNVFVCTD